MVSVLAEYYIDGVKNTETKETLFTLEVDRGSFVNLTVTSLPQNHTWVEWDNYGAGRTIGTKVTVYVDSDRNIIGYLSRNATSFVGPQIIVIPGFTNESIFIGFLFAVTVIYLLRVNRKK